MKYAGKLHLVSTIKRQLLEGNKKKVSTGKHAPLIHTRGTILHLILHPYYIDQWVSTTCLPAYHLYYCQGRMRIKGGKHAKKNMLTVGRRVLTFA